MSLLELLPHAMHGLGDYLVIGLLGAAGLAAIGWSARGGARVLAMGGLGVAIAAAIGWTHARHTWTHAQLAAARAEVDAARADVAARDAAIASHRREMDALQAKIAQVEAGAADDEATSRAADVDLDARLTREKALQAEIDAREKALGRGDAR